MSDKSNWITRLNPFREAAEIKTLKNRLDTVTDKLSDSMEYEAKFFDAEPGSFSGGGMTEFAGIDQIVNAAALAKVYATETWVYVAVNAVAQTIAGLPVKVEKKKTVKKKIKNEITGEDEEVSQDYWVDASGEKLFKRFAYPNPYCPAAEFYTLLLIDLLTAGEYYVYLDSDQDLTSLSGDVVDNDPNSPFGRLAQAMSGDTPIKAMYRIPPSLMKPVPAEDNPFKMAGYLMQSDRGAFAYNPAEIIHVKLPNPTNPHHGLSPLIAAFKPVLLDRFTTEHMIRFYKSGARLGGIIETDKTLNKEQLGRFQRSFENNYTGRQNFHRTLILPPGMKYNPIEQNPAQTALIEFCKYNREAILSAYRVPPIKAGILDNANYANARAQLKTFFNDTVKPILTFVEGGFNLKNTLMPNGGVYRMRFDLSNEDALKDDYAEMAKSAKDMTESGLTVNEIRKLVFDAQPIDGGDQSPVVAKMRREALLGLGGTPSPAATPAAPVDPNAPADSSNGEATQAQEDIAENQVTDPTLSLNGAQVTAMLDILNRVAQGLLPRDSGVEMIIAAFSVQREVANRIMGTVGSTFTITPDDVQGAASGPKDPTDPTAPPTEPATPGKAVEQADAAAMAGDLNPTTGTFSERVEQLTAQYVAEGMPVNLAVRRAMEQARLEGFTDDDNDPEGGGSAPPAAPSGDDSGTGSDTPPSETPPDDAKTLNEKLTEALAKLGDTPITPALIASILAEIQASPKELEQPAAVYRFGMSKDKTAEAWKGFIDKTNPLIDKRLLEVLKFFKDFRSIVHNRLGANLKAYGMHKARDEDDINEILDPDAFDALLAEYIKQVDQALLEAAKHGYGETLANFEFGPPDEKAAEYLRKYAGEKVKGIRDTTLEQLRATLAEAFGKEEGASIQDVAKAITAKFDEIGAGRAQTIARTETLTAVSVGNDLKREEYQKEFPDKKLMKMWVSAQDEDVRDSHRELDGTSVGIDEEFKSGLRYPRDPNGAAEEVINCRCTDLTFQEDNQEAIEATLPKKDDEDYDKTPR